MIVNTIIIILAIILAVVGFVGGKWFWQKMEESPVFAKMRTCVGIAGVVGTLVLFLVAAVLIWMLETQTPECLRQVLTPVNSISWFLCFYMLGYDTSLFRPLAQRRWVSVAVESEGLGIRLKWDLVEKCAAAGLAAIVLGMLLFLASIFTFAVLLMLISAVVGFVSGFMVWEHLKETDIFAGSFKHQLLILSVLTTMVIAAIAGCGIYVAAGYGGVELPRVLWVSVMLFIEGLAWYMLSLCVVAFRAR
jgi:hypothetical protein